MADPTPTRTKEEDAAASRVGSTVRGKWRLDALLGVGGVAAVYAATHRNGQRAALKIMHAELARDRGIVERFLREAYVANKIGHPACVRVMDDDVTESDEPFLVMELLEGETVRDYWRRTGRTIPISQALHIAERVLDCLAACHGGGVVHRDLKPANIFLVRSGAIKLLDFGVAREEGARHEGDKTAGLALGTPAYMSPEQAKGQIDRIDGRSDLFSVGALLHALITGRRIHRGKTEKESLHLAATEPVPSVATVDASLPAELVRLIDKGLAWEPERRFASAREMQSAVLAAMRVATDAGRSAPDEAAAEDDAPDLTPVHEVVARDDPRVREIESLLARCQQALLAGLMHGFDSPSAEPPMRLAFDACADVLRKRTSAIVLWIRPFGFATFDHMIWEPAPPLSAVPHRLFEAGLRLMRILPGLDFHELKSLLACIGAPGDIDVGSALWEASLPHVRVEGCIVADLGDIATREAFGVESLRDETRSAHHIHAARDAGAAWGDEASPLAPDDVVRAVYASQLSVDRWDDRFAELYTDALLQAARARNVGVALGAIRKIAAELYTARRYEDGASLRAALTERLARRVGPKDAPKLAAAVTSAMLGKDALDTLLRTAARHPQDLGRVRPLLEDVPAGEAATVLAGASRPAGPEFQSALAGLVARLAGPNEAEAVSKRVSRSPPAAEVAPDAILPFDAHAERHARIVIALAMLLDAAPEAEKAVASLAADLATETSAKGFEIFFGEAATFVGGRLLYAERAVHAAAQSTATLLARCGAHALVCTAAPSADQLRAFAQQTRGALDRAAPLAAVGPISLVALSQAARTRGIAMERLALEPRVMRVHASAVAALRALRREGTAEIPRAILHVARSIVDVATAPAWLLAAVTEPEPDADEASIAASTAILATAMARLLVDHRSELVRVALAALTVPLVRDEEDALPRAALALVGQTSGTRTAIARAVIAYESAWLARVDRDGAVYRGARAPALHARLVACAREYLTRLGDRTPPPPTPTSVVATLAQRAADTADRTVLRLLVATLGFIPAGTVVRLSSGETAEVIASNRATSRGPLARLVLDESGEEYSEPFEVELALSGDEGLRIDKVLGIEQWRKGETVAPPKSASKVPLAAAAPPAAPRASAAPAPPSQKPPPSLPHVRGMGPREVGSTPRPPSVAPGPSPSIVPPAQKPTANGTFATTPLVNTLVYVLDHALSGTIELREPDATLHQIHFVSGAAVRVRTGRLFAPLGALLVAGGQLTDVAAAEAVAHAKRERVRLGKWLVERKMITRDDLLRALERQVTRKIEALVGLDAATSFAFYRDADLFSEPASETLDVSALTTILAATRAWTDRERVRTLVGRASGLTLTVHQDSLLGQAELTEHERRLLQELHTKPSTYGELATRSGVPADAIETFVFVALVTRQFAVPGQTKPPMGIVPKASPAASVAPAPASTRRGQEKISWNDWMAVRGPPPAPSALRSSVPPQNQPKPPPAPVTGSAAEPTATIRRAEQLLAQENIEGALELAERAHANDARVPWVQAFHAWVRLLAGQSRPTDALAQIDEALTRDATCVPARLLRAKLLKREARVPEAMRELETVLASEPENKDAQNELKLLVLTMKPNR